MRSDDSRRSSILCHMRKAIGIAFVGAFFSAVASRPLHAAAAITLTKSAQSASVTAPGTATWNIQVKSTGTNPALNVVVNDDFGSTFVWSTSTAGCFIVGGGFLTCNVASMAGNTTFDISVSATTDIHHCGLIQNQATGSADNAGATASNVAEMTITGC